MFNMENKTHIRIARENRKLTVGEAARLCGVSYHTYRFWEIGKHRPRNIKDVKAIKKVFGLTTDQILGL
jgi:DNA-binding XRE family transcriptional regulator